MDAEHPTGLADAGLASPFEQAQAEPVEDVRIEHGADPPAHGLQHHKHGVPAFAQPSRLIRSGGDGDRCRSRPANSALTGSQNTASSCWPKKVSAPMTAIAMRARMSAYSARP